MNDFEIQRRLREMNAPRAPQADLWPDIRSRLGETASPSAARGLARRWLPLTLAAGLPLGFLGIALLLSSLPPAPRSDYAALERAPPYKRELAHEDPRLAGAAIVLDAAQIELRQAIAQNPDADFLVELLNRTEARRNRLDRYGNTAS